MTKIISLSQFQPPQNKTIVLVTGVFDILHSEHQKFLIKAKQQDNILLVGLESDTRVKKLKGSHRPINSINIRLKNLADLNIADYVFSLPQKFNTKKDYQNIIKQIKPHILAISSHTPNQPLKKKILEKYGGKIKVVLPHNPQVSTTKIIKKS